MRPAGPVLAAAVAVGAGAAVWWQPGPAERAPARAVVTVLPLPLPEVVRRGVLGPGEHLGALLQRLGMAPHQVPPWVEEARRLVDLRALPVGLVAEARGSAHGEWRSLRLLPHWSTEVVLERTAEGVRGRRAPRPPEVEAVVVRGQVRSSLFAAVLACGEGEALALALADVFQWDLDFHREVQRGDAFAVLVERHRAEGRLVGYGPVLAAVYERGPRRLTAVRFTSEGASGYYDEQGRPLRKQFLRSPLKLSRVSSRFSASRLHPVLGRRLPHWGVDYAAPEGTPVMVTADGTVIFRGWRGGGGNTVEVRHAGGYVTAYLHLSRFAAGVAPGAQVRQGQVIGYVGSTGVATGPHLDYRVTRYGAYLNPARLAQDPAPPLREVDRPAFAARVAALLPLLEVAGPVEAARLAGVAAGGGPGG